MTTDPLVVNSGPAPPPPPPTERTCPGDYKKHKGACFKFGAHSSYEMAKTSCDAAGARLADVDQTFVKYIRDQVRTMGGNDFWIGSFTNNGRVFRQKGRTSCPLLRGQTINDAFYGLVDCNSANRYICQKYGRREDIPGLEFNQGAYGLDTKTRKKPGFNIVATPATESTTTASTGAEGGGTSPVIYVVVTIVVIVLLLIALKLLFNRYMNNKKKAKKPPSAGQGVKNPSQEKSGNGIVFSPKWRQGPVSKASSVDSAVPPSNPSPSLEKHYNRSPRQQEKPLESSKEPPAEPDNPRMGRPRVNGPEPTRLPPHVNGDIMSSRSLRRARDDKDYRKRRHKRTYSDPRSDYGRVRYSRNDPNRRRRASYYSDYSGSNFDSDSDDSVYYGRRYGPRKVYQRYPSEYRVHREPQHYHFGGDRVRSPRRESHYDPYGRDGRDHYGRSQRRSTHGNFYYNEGHRRQSRHPSQQQRYASYGRTKASRGERNRSHMPSISARVAEQQVQERQYFPQPHRLMSWTDPEELHQTPASTDQLVHVSTRSFPREPIWVNRQIHQPPKPQKHKRNKKSKHKDENHIYETLDELNRNKQLKKAKRKNGKKSEGQFKRNASTRASARSVTSIQSRRLPSPPT